MMGNVCPCSTGALREHVRRWWHRWQVTHACPHRGVHTPALEPGSAALPVAKRITEEVNWDMSEWRRTKWKLREIVLGGCSLSIVLVYFSPDWHALLSPLERLEYTSIILSWRCLLRTEKNGNQRAVPDPQENIWCCSLFLNLLSLKKLTSRG